MNAYFVKSAAKVGDVPPPLYPEVAFAGRSNVGKSSLINKILERKNLVKTGKTPGKTRLLNFFMVEEHTMFVDLPGYGYAAVSKGEQASWGKMLDSYFQKRKNLTLCFILVDIRREIQEEERMLMKLLDLYGIAHCLVLTKSDKLSGNTLTNQKKKFSLDTGDTIESLIHFSSLTGAGVNAVREKITETTGLVWR